ncbi:DUF6124 family protein [Pseudomonas sp. PDM04]|uniref:DUF6124 family protein n=1 Tax=unclassified Pseudomonas TaxID=196821 RepID=UPI00177D8A83|nr:DUF6124 family protein [Pseudomonas sp. PDM04]MBD9440845.1 hypothetical protein [Pseudomonas sp. PDM04]
MPKHTVNSSEHGLSMLTVDPNADPRSITIQAFETFCSVNDLLLDLADSLDDKARRMAVMIHQMSEFGLMLVEKSLENQQANGAV